MATFTKSVASPSNKLTNIALQLKRTSVQMNFQSLETNKKLFERLLCTPLVKLYNSAYNF